MDQVVSSKKSRPVVVIESPFAGDLQTNIHYADCLLFDSLVRGEVPFMGHLLYPRVFDDRLPSMRDAGIQAHIAMIERADYVVIGLDLGAPSSGMRFGIKYAIEHNKPIVERFLGPFWRDIELCPTFGFRVCPYLPAKTGVLGDEPERSGT